jgi:hypothetical protein
MARALAWVAKGTATFTGSVDRRAHPVDLGRYSVRQSVPPAPWASLGHGYADWALISHRARTRRSGRSGSPSTTMFCVPVLDRP